MRLHVLPMILLPMLAACVAPQTAVVTPEARTGAGVGFGDPAAYQRQRAQLAAERARRNAQLRTAAAPAPAAPADPPGDVTPIVEPSTAENPAGLDPSILDAVDAVDPLGDLPPPPEELPELEAPGPVIEGRAPAAATGLSDEQDFAAVSGRESIESDAARRARLQAGYVQVAATAVPQRPRDVGANVAAYALTTENEVGQAVYRRAALFDRSRRACSRFRSGAAAQLAFLEAGGPRSDRLGVDPDGDGFACDWDPRPLRAAAGR